MGLTELSNMPFIIDTRRISKNHRGRWKCRNGNNCEEEGCTWESWNFSSHQAHAMLAARSEPPERGPQPERLSQSSGETFIAPALRRRRCACLQGGMSRPCKWTVADAHETGLCHQCRPRPWAPDCRCSCVYCDPQTSDSSVFSEQSTPEDLPQVPEDWDKLDVDPEGTN